MLEAGMGGEMSGGWRDLIWDEDPTGGDRYAAATQKSPERRLAVRFLADAIGDADRAILAAPTKPVEAMRIIDNLTIWATRPAGIWPYSLHDLCDYLGLNVDICRSLVLGKLALARVRLPKGFEKRRRR